MRTVGRPPQAEPTRWDKLMRPQKRFTMSHALQPQHPNEPSRNAAMTVQEHQVTIEILGTNLPETEPGADGAFRLGIQKGDDVLNSLPTDGECCLFRPAFRVRQHTDGSANFLGPFAHGPRTERFIYLNWMVVIGGAVIARPGRMKLHLSHIPWTTIESTVDAGTPIKVTLALSDASGKPLFASFRADAAQWIL